MITGSGKWRHWVGRFGVAELVGLIGSYAGYGLLSKGGPVAAVYGASIGENCGYYATIFLRDWRATPPGDRSAMRILGAMLHDFGLAEALDSFVIRPGVTGLAVVLAGTAWGVGLGKVISDLVFYAFTIAFYERRRAREVV
jgi:hypothetical protein